MTIYTNTYKIISLIIIGISSILTAKAQYYCELPTVLGSSGYVTANSSTYCNNTHTNTNSTYLNRYKNIITWIPDSYFQVKHIKVAVHVFTGPGTIQNTQSTINDINQMIAWVNDIYTNVAPPSYPISGVTPLSDTKIRFDLDNHIYFYPETGLHTSNDFSILYNHINQNYVSSGIDPTRLEYLPIYITIGGGPAKAIAPHPIFIQEYIPVISQYLTPNSLYGDEGVFISTAGISYPNAQTLAHELGHTLDLMHTYQASCCHETCDYTDPEYLYDLFGAQPPINSSCWETGGWNCTIIPGVDTCTNNMMAGLNLTSYYFSPMQIGKMHRALSIKSARKYVKPMTSSTNEWVVNQNETWDFDIQMYQNIRVTNGATLTIKCKVAMATNGIITVDNGAHLVISDGATVTTWTGSMWNGIMLNPGANLTVDNATIENAKIGIQSNGGAPFTIQNGSKLNANRIGIAIGIYNGTHPGIIKNSTISCYNSSGVPANALLPPYSGTRSNVGIYILASVTQVNIGVDQSGQTNTFDNMDIGIYCVQSGLRVYNTTFKNINGSGTIGRCIMSSANSTTERLLVVGGNSNSYQKNTFLNSTTGVYASGSMDVSVLSNTMNNLTTGVSLNNCSYSGNGFNISNNTIDDCSTGIYSIDCAGSSGFWVLSNNINLASPTSNSKPNSKGISILNTSLNTNPQLSIFYNNIKRVSTGIEVTNHTAPGIQSNNITNLSDLGSSIASHGILITNCPSLNLRTNLVSGSGLGAYWMNGIRIEPGCTNSVILYNTVNDIGRGLFFSGSNLGTETAKNHVKNTTDGFLLNWGTIGYQNGSPGSCKATENTWEGTFSGNHIFSYYSDGTQSTMNLYGNPCNTSSGPCMRPNNLVSGVYPASGYAAVPTPVCAALSGRSMTNNALSQFIKVANDEYNFPARYNASAKWWAKYSLYNMMQTDTTLQEFPIPELTTFANNNSTTNIGKLYNLNTAVNTGDATIATFAINNFNPENAIEQYLKDVYTINISYHTNDTLTGSEISTLQAIAQLCPYESGPAVYNARVLLSTVDTAVYVNECEIVPLLSSHKNLIIEDDNRNDNIVIFPNPATYKLNLTVILQEGETATLTIYDITGKLILSDTFNSDNEAKEISVSALSEGMYIYKVNVNNENVKQGKLIITR